MSTLIDRQLYLVRRTSDTDDIGWRGEIEEMGTVTASEASEAQAVPLPLRGRAVELDVVLRCARVGTATRQWR